MKGVSILVLAVIRRVKCPANCHTLATTLPANPMVQAFTQNTITLHSSLKNDFIKTNCLQYIDKCFFKETTCAVETTDFVMNDHATGNYDTANMYPAAYPSGKTQTICIQCCEIGYSNLNSDCTKYQQTYQLSPHYCHNHLQLISTTITLPYTASPATKSMIWSDLVQFQAGSDCPTIKTCTSCESVVPMDSSGVETNNNVKVQVGYQTISVNQNVQVGWSQTGMQIRVFFSFLGGTLDKTFTGITFTQTSLLGCQADWNTVGLPSPGWFGEVPTVDSAPVGEQWTTIQTQAQRILGYSNCDTTKIEYAVMDSSNQEIYANNVKILRDHVSTSNDGGIQVNLDKYLADQTVYFKMFKVNENETKLLNFKIGVRCKFNLDQTNYQDYSQGVPLATADAWETVADVSSSLTGSSHQTGCPITMVLQTRVSGGTMSDNSNVNVKLEGGLVKVNRNSVTDLEYHIKFTKTDGTTATSDIKRIKTQCISPTINNKASIETTQRKQVANSAAAAPELILTVMSSLNSNNVTCVQILKLYDNSDAEYDQNNNNFVTLNQGTGQLYTNIIIRQSGLFKIGYSINGVKKIITNSFTVEVVCKDLVVTAGTPTSYLISVPAIESSVFTKIFDGDAVIVSDQLVSQCQKKQVLTQSGSVISFTTANPANKEYFESERNVYINPNLVQNQQYVIQFKYLHEPATALKLYTFTVKVECTNSSNTFTLGMINNTHTQVWPITSPPTNPLFKINSISASQTKSCGLTKVELATDQSTIVVTPTCFSPASFISFSTWPLVFSCSLQTQEQVRLFYIKLSFEGGYTYAVVNSKSQFTLDVSKICTGTPSVTLTDKSPIKKFFPKDGSQKVISLGQSLVDRFQSSTSNCAIKQFQLLDYSSAVVDPSIGISQVMRTPFDTSEIMIDASKQINGTMILRGQTDLGGQADLEVQIFTCGINSLQLVGSPNITSVLALESASAGLVDEVIVSTKSQIGSMMTGPDCSGCTPELRLKQSGSPYQGTDASINSLTGNLQMKTSIPLQLNLEAEAFFSSDCDFINPVSIPIDILVCGQESVNLVNSTDLNYTIAVGQNFDDIKLPYSQIISMFNNSQSKCNLTYLLASTQSDPITTAPWSSYISLNQSDGLVVRHVGSYPNGSSNNYTLTFYIRATSAGKKQASRKVNLNFIYQNFVAPSFSSPLKPVSLSFTSINGKSIDFGEQSFYSPPAQDQKGDQVTLSNIKVSPTPACSCFTTSVDGQANILKVKIDKQKLGSADAKEYSVSVNVSNSNAFKVFSFVITVTETVSGPKPQDEPLQTTNPTNDKPTTMENTNDNNLDQTQNQSNQTKSEADKPKSQAQSVGAAFNPWVQKASADEIAKLMGGLIKQTSPVPNATKPKPVILRVREINRNGIMTVEFNQRLRVPAFIDQPQLNQTHRELIPLSALDVQRDIMDIIFELNSNVEPDEIKFFLQIEEWGEQEMKIFINFTNPLLISQGLDKDVIICKVLNRQLFTSYDFREVLSSERIYIQKALPRQLPVGVSEEKLMQEAQTASNGMKAILIVQILLQLCLKGALNDFWVMFFTLQIICYLKIYDVAIPGNADIYVVEFTKLIEFDLLNPDSIIRMITDHQDFVLINWIIGKDKFDSDGSPSMIEDLRLFILGGVAAFAVVVFVAVLMICQPLKLKLKKLLWQVYNKFVFNGIIRSLTIMYIQLCMSFGSQIEVFLRGTEGQSIQDSISGICMSVAMFAYPIFCWIIILKKKLVLETPNVLARISNLYQDIKLKKTQNWKLVYYPLFLIRRIVFVAIPTFLFGYPSHQLQILIFLTSLYILYYTGERPHWDRRRGRIEVFNEVMILGATYHLVCFSDFNLDTDAQFKMGYSFIALFGIVVVVNVAVVVRKQYLDLKRKRELKLMLKEKQVVLQKIQKEQPKKVVKIIEEQVDKTPNQLQLINPSAYSSNTILLKPLQHAQKQSGSSQKSRQKVGIGKKASKLENIMISEKIQKRKNNTVVIKSLDDISQIANLNRMVMLGDISVEKALKLMKIKTPRKSLDDKQLAVRTVLRQKILERINTRLEQKYKDKEVDLNAVKQVIEIKLDQMHADPDSQQRIRVSRILKESKEIATKPKKKQVEFETDDENFSQQTKPANFQTPRSLLPVKDSDRTPINSKSSTPSKQKVRGRRKR